MPDLPNVTVAPTTDGGLVGFVHAGMKVRTIFADTFDRIRDRLPGVLVAEFGMTADEAHAHAQASDGKSIAVDPQVTMDHVTLLQEQLTECQAELEVERAEMAALRAKLTAATAQPPQSDSAPATGAELQTQAGETPPADAGLGQNAGVTADDMVAAGQGEQQPTQEDG